MHKNAVDNTITFSAVDLTDFISCPHLTKLSLSDLESPLPRTEPDAALELIIKKAIEHEKSYLRYLIEQGYRVTSLSDDRGDPEMLHKATIDALKSGADYIYQATLFDGTFLGRADFLIKVPMKSGLGDYSYEVLDVKLSKSPKPEAIIQLCNYSELLSNVQGLMPSSFHILLGNGLTESYKTVNYICYCRSIKAQFLTFISHVNDEEPFPCEHCSISGDRRSSGNRSYGRR